MCSAIARADVAPGDGALRTCTTRSVPVMTKSSRSRPWWSIAWARIPRGPRETSSVLMSETYLRASATKRVLLSAVLDSRIAAGTLPAANRQKPENPTVSRTSRRSTCRGR